jgi:predicted porin
MMKTATCAAIGALSMLPIAVQAQEAKPEFPNAPTVYGIVDLSLEQASAGAGSVSRVSTGGWYSSRLGFRGGRVLRGGLRAVYQLEMGIAADTGDFTGNRPFARGAWVGLEGNHGRVTLGARQLTPFWSAFTRTDTLDLALAGGHPTIARTTAGTSAGILTGYSRIVRAENSIQYFSPKFGNGFSFKALYGFGETRGSSQPGRTLSASAHYEAGPADLNVAFARNDDADGYGEANTYTFGGSYLVGRARVYFGHMKDENDTASTATTRARKAAFTLTNIGARYPIAPYTTAFAQVTRVRDRSEGLTVDRDATVFAVGGYYELAQGTWLYGNVGMVTNQNGSNYSIGGGGFTGVPAGGDKTGRTLIVGIRHNF